MACLLETLSQDGKPPRVTASLQGWLHDGRIGSQGSEVVERRRQEEFVKGVLPEYYEQRPLIEEYHKCLKTGCRVESRRY